MRNFAAVLFGFHQITLFFGPRALAPGRSLGPGPGSNLGSNLYIGPQFGDHIYIWGSNLGSNLFIWAQGLSFPQTCVSIRGSNTAMVRDPANKSRGGFRERLVYVFRILFPIKSCNSIVLQRSGPQKHFVKLTCCFGNVSKHVLKLM